MNTLEDKIDKDLNQWEEKIQKVSEYAEDLRPLKRLKIYQGIFNLEKDILKLKSSLRMLKYFPKDKYHTKRDRIIKDHKNLDRKIKLSKLIEKATESNSEEGCRSWNSILQIIKNNEVDLKHAFKDKKALKTKAMEALTETKSGIRDFEKWLKKNKKELAADLKVQCNQAANELKYYQLQASSLLHKLMSCPKENWKVFRKEFIKAYSDLAEAWVRHRDLFLKVKRNS